MSFILILLLVFVFVGFVRVYAQYRRIRNAMRGQANAYRRRTEEQRRYERPGGWSPAPSRKQKKIDPTVGEYVEFTEMEATTTSETDAQGNTRVRTEAQVTDVKWEDIPDKN